MHLSSVFYIFVTVLVLGQCDHSHQRKHFDYTNITKVDCTAVRRAIVDTLMNASCKPHYKHVPLKPMPSQEFQPSVVSVRRCDGNCPRYACMPIETRMVKVPVRLTTFNSEGIPNITCALANVEEHLRCRCKCQMRELECNSNQYWIKDHCTCGCLNRDIEKRECEMKKGMVWDDEGCSCNCTQLDLDCRTDLKWNRDKCECV